MYGHVDVEADSLEEAIDKVENETQLSDINAEYVSESFKIDEMVVCLSQPTRKDESWVTLLINGLIGMFI